MSLPQQNLLRFVVFQVVASTPDVHLSQQAAGRLTTPRDDAYPFRAIVRGERHDGTWVTLEVFENATEEAAKVGAVWAASEYSGFAAMHYYVGEVG